MRKIISLVALLLLVSMSIVLCSCDDSDGDKSSNNDIIENSEDGKNQNNAAESVENVMIEYGSDSWKNFYVIYLYKFKDAKIDKYIPDDSFANSSEDPTNVGYVYSFQKLKKGDKISVWKQFRFGDDDYRFEDGTYAIVDEIVDKFEVEVCDKSESCIITYYTNEGSYSFSQSLIGMSATQKDNLEVIEQRKIQVTKDRVIIMY